jgi:hypothetical protein
LRGAAVSELRRHAAGDASALEFAAAHHQGSGAPPTTPPSSCIHWKSLSLEETDATPLELEQRFGPVVAALVCSVSEPSGGGSYAQRKARLRSAVADTGPEWLAVYAAEKVAKVRELRMTLARDWSAAVRSETADKLHHYWASLALLESLLADDPLVSQLRFELEALATLPPRTPGALPVAQHAGS